MFPAIARSGSIAASLAATAQVVPSTTRPVITELVKMSDKMIVNPTTTSSPQLGSCTSMPKVTQGMMSSTQLRFAHTDVRVPDYSAYRKDEVGNRNTLEANRKAFTYLIVGGGAVTTAYAAKSLVTEFVQTMSASADVLAMAKIEVKLADIPEGKNTTLKWRGKPLFVRHRTAAEIEAEQNVDVSSLRDPESDDARTQKPEWLVLIGVCTHLGCVPIAGTGEYGGYYCPCHGSHYDASGRIRKGPAPLNLEVPAYTFTDDETLLVG